MDAGTKALRALRLLGQRGSLGVTELASGLGVSTSSAHRILAALCSEGFALHDPGTRRYVLGPSRDELGPSAVMDVTQVAGAHLRALSARTQETANLVTVRGQHLHFLDGVEGVQTVRVALRTGEQLHAAMTAGGKALLASRPDAEIRALLGRHWSGRTHHSVRDIDRLLTELAEVRRSGFARNHEESVEGVFAVGAAAVVTGRVPVAVTVSAPVSRATPDRVAAWSELVRAAARSLGQDLTRA